MGLLGMPSSNQFGQSCGSRVISHITAGVSNPVFGGPVSNPNYTHLNQLIKVCRITTIFQAGTVFCDKLLLNFAGHWPSRSRFGHPCITDMAQVTDYRILQNQTTTIEMNACVWFFSRYPWVFGCYRHHKSHRKQLKLQKHFSFNCFSLK